MLINGQKLYFRSPLEFEFAISSKVEPPATRVIDLERKTLFELRRMAADIHQQETQFSHLLAESLENDLLNNNRSLGALMAAMDTKQFSSDHQWRSIFAAFVEQPNSVLDPYRRIALAKYMQYLRERQRVIQDIYTHRGTEANVSKPHWDTAQPNNPQLETSIFNFVQMQTEDLSDSDLWMLPRGESVAITLNGTREMDLILAIYPFKLTLSDHTYLTDVTGNQYLLAPGRNIIGRSQGCDVVLNVKYCEISRKHLIIDRIDAQTIALTDLSSHGTQVPVSRVMAIQDNNI